MAEYIIYKTALYKKSGDILSNNPEIYYNCTIYSTHKYKGPRIVSKRIIAKNTVVYLPSVSLDNSNKLFEQIAKLYKHCDKINTISELETTSHRNHKEVRIPLSHEELKIITAQVLSALGNR